MVGGGGGRGDVEVGERGLREVQAEGRVWVWEIEGSTAPGDTLEVRTEVRHKRGRRIDAKKIRREEDDEGKKISRQGF